MLCSTCNAEADCRPYGLRGAFVCFKCAMATLKAKAETERNFANQLDAIKGPAILDGTHVGPYPLKHFKDTP